ncbi:MAG: hypothetical protein VW268_02915 [Rhodospirillaceae bacterium]
MTYTSDVAFSPTVKAIQTRKGSRDVYAEMEAKGGWLDSIDPGLAAFIGDQTSVFLGAVNAAGQTYIQHRGGAAGFSKPWMKKPSVSQTSRETANT